MEHRFVNDHEISPTTFPPSIIYLGKIGADINKKNNTFRCIDGDVGGGPKNDEAAARVVVIGGGGRLVREACIGVLPSIY